MSFGYEMTLNYRMMVERYPNLKAEVGGSNLGCEISSLLDGKLVRWSTVSCALALACRHSVSQQKKKEKRRLNIFKKEKNKVRGNYNM